MATPTIVSGSTLLTRPAPHPTNISIYVPTSSAKAYILHGNVGINITRKYGRD